MRRKIISLIVLAVCLSMLMGIVACNNNDTPAPGSNGGTTSNEPAVNPNIPDYRYIQPAGEIFDINSYYNDKDPLLAANVTIRSTGGLVEVPDNPTTAMPQARERWTVGFSVYYTVDEVGAMILDTMVEAAAAAGVNLLVNDANYDQNAQNMAIEQWILQGVDGVILAPCDFYGVADALERLTNAGIPVVTLNPPLAGAADSIVMLDCVEQGYQAAEMLIEHLNRQGTPISGKIIINQISFLHPNAVCRELGFRQAFASHPGVEFIVLTGLSPEEHYIAFEGALLAHPDAIGAFGIYSSAVIGMMNAKLAANSAIPITAIDNDKLILAGIKEGNIIGSSCYSSTAPSFWSMSLLINMLNGVEIPGTLFYQNTKVTADNVDAMFAHYYAGQTLANFMQTG